YLGAIDWLMLLCDKGPAGRGPVLEIDDRRVEFSARGRVQMQSIADQLVPMLDSLAIAMCIGAPAVLAAIVVARWIGTSNRGAELEPDWIDSGQLESNVLKILVLAALFLGGIAWLDTYGWGEPS